MASDRVPDVHWIEPGFGIGSRPYPEDRLAIARTLGVEAVLALHEASEGEAEHWTSLGVQFHPFPTTDWVAIPHRRFDDVVGALRTLQDDGKRVLLHCLAGINRAPTVAAAYLALRDGLTHEEAVRLVRAARPSAAPTPEQMKSLKEWLARRARPRSPR